MGNHEKHSLTERWTVLDGDVRGIGDRIEPLQFDAVLCDAPYELGFMGRSWDRTGVAFQPETWAAILRVCKPGAPLLSFGGSRTMHRIACAVEDGGWQIRDMLMWLYGSGFPKSHNVSKAIDKAAGVEREVIGTRKVTGTARIVGGGGFTVEAAEGNYQSSEVRDEIPITAPATEAAKDWDGYGTALKPAYEPIVLARAPLDGTIVENVLKWGCGALAIDASRIEYVSDEDQAAAAAAAQRTCQDETGNGKGIASFQHSTQVRGVESLPEFIAKQSLGRWPANVLLDEESALVLDRDAGEHPSVPYPPHEPTGKMFLLKHGVPGGYAEHGGPSRFFFTAKASREDRDHGLKHTPKKSIREMVNRDPNAAGTTAYAGAGWSSGSHNNHPTVKPTDLLEYLAKLILPPRRSTPRRLFVPFAGSGSEMIAALRAGWDEVVGIELEFGELARERLAHADVAHQTELFGT